MQMLQNHKKNFSSLVALNCKCKCEVCYIIVGEVRFLCHFFSNFEVTIAIILRFFISENLEQTFTPSMKGWDGGG